MVWNPGHRLFGARYIVQRKLGQGGFGITYLVKNRKGQLFVVKTLKDEVMTDTNFEEYRDKYLRDFDREALKLAICRHPHIVRIENHFYEQRLPCLVMEYIEGEDLSQRLKRDGALSEAEATRYIKQIGDALSLVHEKGLLHRDVKPQNIMMRNDANQRETGEAVLIDFGIAREFIPDLTQTQTALVSPSFAPLEQYNEQARRGEFTDVYALAGTFYYLVTGKLPQPAYMRVVRDSLRSPQEINPQISDAASLAILAGLQLHSENRPQSMLEWLELLSGEEEGITPDDKSGWNYQVIIENADSTTKTSGRRIILPTTEGGSVELDVVEDLNSERGVDYRRLRDLLKAGKWKEADRETASCMLKAAKQEKSGWLIAKDFNNFPSHDLLVADRLWLKYSDGRFGFSVQQRIYEELGGTGEYDERIWEAFGDRVDWRHRGNWLEYKDFSLNAQASSGHLPGALLLTLRGLGNAGGFGVWRNCWALLSRTKACLNPRLELTQVDADDLSSERGVDYQPLRDLLKAGEWKEADEETASCLLTATDQQKKKYLDEEDIDKFPCTDLRTIDRLWLKYSKGRFGFSVQKRIYQELGGTREYDEKLWEIFADWLGWRQEEEWLNYEDLTWDRNCGAASLGHLPRLGTLLASDWDSLGLLLSRAETCLDSRLEPLQFDAEDLISERGIDYRRLRDLLKAGEWKEADRETDCCILTVVEREERGCMEKKDYDCFPCTDLRTIDILWVKYSNGRFGFSIQKQIYQELGGIRGYDGKIWRAFGDRVGWRQGGKWLDYEDLTWEKNCELSPMGHLPALAVAGGGGPRGEYLLSRAETCQL